ncbi:hypothetical protein NUK34_08185 [Kerstersia gyiorum]|uniref:hypothetical protein n=1 Tax=Kerstersia gyiorum TaxID=206506 RepID=UPI00215055EA|nr:hypothetical protein [Kerstersia gyiorum]MCR4158830.1 hypothetical protein [Kerstersia gyiorum]
MEAQAVGSKLVVTDYGIRVEPTGRIGPREIVEIPFEQIASIRWKPASFFLAGWMQFATAGNPAGVLSSPSRQPGSVIFKRSQQKEIEKIKTLVQEKIISLRTQSG